MARHIDITAALGAPVYFCDSRSPWQRGRNENANGLLRHILPKRHQPEPVHARAPDDSSGRVNKRPRRVLGDRSPTELFTALLASQDHQLLRR